MKRKILGMGMLFGVMTQQAMAQEAPNVANSAQQTAGAQSEGKLMNTPVNLFTGVPDISVPIYQYDGADGMRLNISLNYNAGGIQVGEQGGMIGLGWSMSSGGSVTRIIRGAPDDMPTTGYMYAGAIPADYRADGSKYYYDSLDAQQDIFMFNCGAGAGKFYIGKNGQIAIVPDSKLSITYTTGNLLDENSVSFNGITSFTIRGEDGTRYIFADWETSKIFAQGTAVTGDGSVNYVKSNYTNKTYTSAWYLTKIIAPFSTDTIYFKYSLLKANASFTLAQTAFVKNSTQTTSIIYKPNSSNFSQTRRLDSITLPAGKKIKFGYFYNYWNSQPVSNGTTITYKYFDSGLVLNTIGIYDSILRKGYQLRHIANTGISVDPQVSNDGYKYLYAVIPFTAKEKLPGYRFIYNSFTDVTPQNPLTESKEELNNNARDHWGYFNGKYNPKGIFPQMTGITNGADRSPDASKALMNSMMYTYLPGGGYIYYEYEQNDHVPYTKSSQQVTVNTNYTTTTNITLTDIVSNQRNINITLSNNSVDRSGTAPLTGTCNLSCSIVDAATGTTTYATFTCNLYELFYTGFKTWSFNLASGTYKLKTVLNGGGTVSGSFPVVFNWENKLTDNTTTATPCGGIRVKRITRTNAIDDPLPVVTEYKYVNTDGKSSGYLGEAPKYDYAYRDKFVSVSTTITDYTAVSSEPVSQMVYAQGSPVGYTRVEAIKGTATNNIGKEVYEFTGPNDVQSNYSTASDPYGPVDMKDWGLGLPERITVYDNTGRLLKSTGNTYSFINTNWNNSNFKSIKLNHICSIRVPYLDDYLVSGRVFNAQEYYPAGGRTVLTATADTVFHPDGSTQVNSKTFTYDAVYFNNIEKITTSYDRNRGLSLETRIYYPYDYTLAGTTTIGKLKDSSISVIPISTEKWIVGDANPRMLSAEITDLTQTAQGYIRPSAIYSLESNAPIAQTTIGTFNASSLVRNTTWLKQQATMPLYDAEGNPLQTTKTVSGQSESVIMDYGNRYAIAKVSNAAYTDVAYTSFESDGSGNWTINSTARDAANYITGKKGYNIAGGTVVKTGLQTGTTYLVTLWAKSGAAVTINGTSAGSSISTHKGWNLYSKTVTGVTTVTISGTGIIDELRLHPKDANMITTTYEPNVGATTVCDANNTIVYTEYDNLNRPFITRDNDGNILKRMGYSDTTMTLSVSPVWGNTQSVTWSGCNYDSAQQDNNLFSFTYKKITSGIKTGANCCQANNNAQLYPRYKMINSVCENAQRWNTSSSYVKITYPDNTVAWKWRCRYYYKWSDGSRSDADITTTTVFEDYEEFNSASCPLGLVND